MKEAHRACAPPAGPTAHRAFMGGVMSAPADGGAPPPKGGHPPSALVVVGPSGVGKGTLIRRLMDGSPEAYGFSVSHTTRAARQVGVSLACAALVPVC